MFIPHGAIVAVADGSGLSLYRNAGTEVAPRLAPIPAPRLEGHSKDAGKRHRSSAANPDDRQLREDSFAAEMAEWLNQQILAGKLEHLFVVAPPKLLGELRRNYHKALKARLVGEISKDLHGRPAEDIEAELKLAKTS